MTLLNHKRRNFLKTRAPWLLLALVMMSLSFAEACIHSSVPSIADQIVAKTAVNQAVSIPDFVHTGCAGTSQYILRTSPDPAPGGAVVAFQASGPSIEISMNGNVDSFAVAISHENSGEVYAYTAFIVHPYDSTATDFMSTFCSENSLSCMCPSNTSCSGSVLDFCSTLFFLQSVA